MFDHPGYPDSEDNTPREIAKIIGMVSAMELASTVMRRLLGQQGVLYDEAMQFPKVAFLDAVACLLDSHYVINIDTVDDLREDCRLYSYEPGSDMREFIKSTNLMHSQLDIDAKLLSLPGVEARHMVRNLIKQVDARECSAFDHILDRCNIALNGNDKVTKRMYLQFCNELIKQAMKKFPDRNTVANNRSSSRGTKRADSFRVNDRVNEGEANRRNFGRFGDNDAASVGEEQRGAAFERNCWLCGSNAHIKRDCPKHQGSTTPDRGLSKNLRGVDRRVSWRHDKDSSLNPGQQDRQRSERKEFGPKVWVKGKHEPCQHQLRMADGTLKVCNKNHLRKHCEEFTKMKELLRTQRETGAARSTVGCIFEPSETASDDHYQDGTGAYVFDESPTPAECIQATYGSNPVIDPSVTTPVFEPLEEMESRSDTSVQHAQSTYFTPERMVNWLGLLMVLSLGCSMLVPSESRVDDDDVFYVGASLATKYPLTDSISAEMVFVVVGLITAALGFRRSLLCRCHRGSLSRKHHKH